jgi:hypothetical protein
MFDLANLFSGGQDPQEAAGKYYGQIPGVLKEGYTPYAEAGQQALGTYSDQLQNLLSDPTALMKMIGSQYKESPGFQHNVDSATQAAMRAAAAGGEAGAPSVQEALAQQISGMASQDYGDYMNKALGLYGTGLSGEQGLGQMGFQASTGLAQNLANALMSQGNMAYSGAQGQQQGGMDLLGSLGQAASMAMGAFL